MKKTTLSPERSYKIFASVQFMAVMAEMIRIEHQMYMDADFKNPPVNNFAGRIRKDADAILMHLKSNPKLDFKNTDPEFSEEYAAEMHRIFHYFIGYPIEKIREFMDRLESTMQEEMEAA